MIRDYENPLVSLNKALLGPYFLGGGGIGGGTLGSLIIRAGYFLGLEGVAMSKYHTGFRITKSRLENRSGRWNHGNL